MSGILITLTGIAGFFIKSIKDLENTGKHSHQETSLEAQADRDQII
jgi:hypothetical protein